jgi:hypothetical protein
MNGNETCPASDILTHCIYKINVAQLIHALVPYVNLISFKAHITYEH